MSAQYPSMRLPNLAFGLDGGSTAQEDAMRGAGTPAAGQRGIGQGASLRFGARATDYP